MIGIVGGGIAGLGAAYRLQQAGREVRVYEAAEDVGGQAATYPTEGDPIERFYHHLSRSEETIVEVAGELGLGEAVEWRIGKNAYLVDGEEHPLDTPAQILRYPHLSLYDKFRLGMLTLGVDVRGGLPRMSTYEDFEAFDHVPVREFVVEHTTESVYERFFEPLLDAKFGERKEEVSAGWLLGRIRFRGERDPLRGEILGYMEGGFGELIDALVDAVGPENIATGTRAVDLRTDDGHIASLTVEDAKGTRDEDVDALVVATKPNVLEQIAGYESEVSFQAVICSLFWLDEPLTDTYWLNLADETTIGAIIEHTNFVPPERYGGQHLVYLARYAQSEGDRIWQMDDEELEQHWTEELDRLFDGFDPASVEGVRTSRDPLAAPVYERGYLDKVVPYDLSDEVAEGVYYAGLASRAQFPERSLNGGLEAGFACAERIAGKG